MATDPKKTPAPGEPDRTKLMRVLIPAGVVAVLVIIVAVVASNSGKSGGVMSDGSDGTVDDPGLKEAAAGVKVRDLKEGTGEPCPAGAKVKVHYTGWLTDGTEFDTSKKGKGDPVEFGLDGVIKGWTIGIPGMKPGGIRKLVIAPEMGYDNQTKGKIPAGSTLIFEVKLESFRAPSAPPRPRRSPPPTDLAKLADGTAPNGEDPGLRALGDKGIKTRDIKEGDGPVVQAGATVVVDYIGWLQSDGKMFDSSWKGGGSPFTAELAPGAPRGVIPGWQQGMIGMKVGGIRKIVIPPALAYADRGAGNDIPPGATLVFEVELLGIE